MWTQPPIKKLQIKHHRQTPGLCGPAALKMALSYFGRHFTEKELAVWAGATTDFGTEHNGLVEAAKKTGAHVIAAEGGTIETLEDFVTHQRLPVIIGWFDHDGDHYSVVVKITSKRLVLADPQTKAWRRFKKKTFPAIWFDFIGQDNRTVSWGWYMVINFDSIPSLTSTTENKLTVSSVTNLTPQIKDSKKTPRERR